jgi:hypothetical protein
METLWKRIALALVVLALLAAGCAGPLLVEQPQPAARGLVGGTTNLDDLTLSGDLAVGGHAHIDGNVSIDGAVTVDNLYPVGHVMGALAIETGTTDAFTGTITTTHSLASVTAMQVSLCADSNANAAAVSIEEAAGEITISAWKADGATAADVGTTACYIVMGTP